MRVGIDLVQISHIARSLDRYGERFTRKLFTEGEIAYCSREERLAAQRFAARFAAKEATVKVLRPAGRWVHWRDIEVRRDASGWCDIVLYARAKELARAAGLRALALSMSHQADFATAIVVAHTAE
ncbi:MAG TPA: holo-ACP synthase [Gemmatimonadaceae bacterium]|nr:holo-ACP synthase [Gemmatimonadaceae bacterium]